MKGIAFDIITYVVIALVGVSLLILFISGALERAVKEAYCTAYRGVILLLPSPEGGEVSLPPGCIPEKEIERTLVKKNDTEYVSREIAAHAIACMETAKRLNLEKNLTCYELILEKPVGLPLGVGEDNVTYILINEGGCPKLENFDYGCGTKDQLIWNVPAGRITTEKIILIEYYYNKNAIGVTA